VKKEREMKIYKIRVTGEVLETAAATRRCKVYGRVLTFGREPVYLQAAKLPPELANDNCLRIEPVDSAPPGVEVLKLKAERIEQPADDDTPPDEEARLKAERIEQPATNDNDPSEETRLKAERIENPTASAASARANTKRR
jgi:hypothetical protein